MPEHLDFSPASNDYQVRISFFFLDCLIDHVKERSFYCFMHGVVSRLRLVVFLRATIVTSIKGSLLRPKKWVVGIRFD